MRLDEAPNARLASTNCPVLNCKTMERTRIVNPGQLKTTNNNMINIKLDPNTNTMKIRMGSKGMLATTSESRWITISTHPPQYPLIIPRVVPTAVVKLDAIKPMNNATGNPNNNPTAKSLPIASVPINPKEDPPKTKVASPSLSCESLPWI